MTLRGLEPDREGMSPTARQIALFRAYCLAGSIKAAAYTAKISEQTLKNSMTALYARLGVHSAVEAMVALGWMHVPDDIQCGWVGRCGRNAGHTGQHGGFRSILRPTEAL